MSSTLLFRENSRHRQGNQHTRDKLTAHAAGNAVFAGREAPRHADLGLADRKLNSSRTQNIFIHSDAAGNKPFGTAKYRTSAAERRGDHKPQCASAFAAAKNGSGVAPDQNFVLTASDDKLFPFGSCFRTQCADSVKGGKNILAHPDACDPAYSVGKGGADDHPVGAAF